MSKHGKNFRTAIHYTIEKTLFQHFHYNAKAHLLNTFAEVPYIWTSRSVESVITITCHFVDTNCNLSSWELKARAISESHTAVPVGEVLSNAVDEWGLKIMGVKYL